MDNGAENRVWSGDSAIVRTCLDRSAHHLDRTETCPSICFTYAQELAKLRIRQRDKQTIYMLCMASVAAC